MRYCDPQASSKLCQRFWGLICTSILVLAKADGWGESLLHGKKTQWFDSKNAMYFAPGGIPCRFKVCKALNVRRNFKEAEMYSHSLFKRRSHQNDKTGEGDEVNLPSYANSFSEFFELVEECASSLTSTRVSR